MFDPKELIIEDKRALDEKVKLRDSIITMVFWILFIYLFRPIFTLALWFVFGDFLFHENVWHDLSQEGTQVIAQNITAFMIFLAIFLFWALYNKIVFGRLHRRRKVPQVAPEEIAQVFGIDPKQLQKLQNAKEITIAFKDFAHVDKDAHDFNIARIETN